jgi:hypothetical protein
MDAQGQALEGGHFYLSSVGCTAFVAKFYAVQSGNAFELIDLAIQFCIELSELVQTGKERKKGCWVQNVSAFADMQAALISTR